MAEVLNPDHSCLCEGDPSLLLWGVPILESDSTAQFARNTLVAVSDKLGEHSARRSEPDVIVTEKSGALAFVEVKYRSANDRRSFDYQGWTKYLESTDCFLDPDGVRESGHYELARNWRIAWDLAQGRPFRLINLGPPSLFNSSEADRLDSFVNGLNQANSASFERLTWDTLLGRIREKPPWLKDYLQERLDHLPDCST